MSRLATISVMTLALMGGAIEAQAQDYSATQGDTKAVQELETLVVTGRKLEEKLSAELAEYGHQVVVIEGETIEKMGYVDLSEALGSLVSGLYVEPNRGNYTSYLMNGSNSSGTNGTILWLLDGVRINNRLYGGAYTDTISTSMIERIEVLMGGEGLFYGTSSTAGAINIITKKPTKELSGQIGATYGTQDLYKVNGYVSRAFGEHQLLAFGSYEEWGGYRLYPDEAYAFYRNNDKRNRQYDRANYGLKYRYEFGENKSNKSLDLHLQRNQGAFDFGRITAKHAVNERDEYILSAKWEHDVSENFSYYVKTYYHEWWTDWSQEEFDGEFSAKDEIWGCEDWGVNILGSYRFDRGDELLVGLDYQNYWGKDYVTTINGDHEEVYAAFFQYRPYFNFWPEWKVAIGGRYNYQKNNDSFVWNISSRMPLYDDHFFLRTSVSTSFILPTAEQLFSDGSRTKGNPALEPQDSLSFTAGLGTTWEKFDLELSGFYEKWDNKIGRSDYQVPIAGGMYYTYVNVDGESTSQGFTISGKYRPVPSLSLSASYTQQKYKENGKEVKRGGVPKDYASVGLHWSDTVYGTPMGVGLSGRWVGSKTYTYTNSATRAVDFYKDYGHYWVANASFYADITDKTRVSLFLSNIFNQETGSWTRGTTSSRPGEFLYYQNNTAPFSATLSVSYSF